MQNTGNWIQGCWLQKEGWHSESRTAVDQVCLSVYHLALEWLLFRPAASQLKLQALSQAAEVIPGSMDQKSTLTTGQKNQT